MSTLRNRKNLLLVVALLAAIRFIVVPVFDWQQENIDDITAKATRLNKAENVIARKETLAVSLTDVEKINERTKTLYHSFSSTNEMKLSLQQQVEKKFSQHKVKIKNFTWPNELEGDIKELRAKIFFEGDTNDIALLHMDLSDQATFFNIVEWTIYIRRMKENSLGEASGSLVFSAYNLSTNLEAK
ncbi:hypothetical protein [Thalassotalea hakodatensis]|uniref:hypothetical protein n=1 Tax=Thalassotalea hakodatensis TaxID=3030492 RepID=UPI002573BF40|nr:hypothetical protein [Thalassotalea hakodatensis]